MSARRIAAASTAIGVFLASGAPLAQPASVAPLTVRVTDLRSNAGQVGCMIYGSPRGFPGDPSAALQRRWCAIDKATATCAFDPMPAGRYAVACFHDENGNGKMDTGLFGIPKEGNVVSNHAKGLLGPPSFHDASFPFRGTPTEMTLRIGY